MPDVCVDLATDPFELVQIFDRHASITNHDAPRLAKRVRVEKLQIFGPVAQNERLQIMGKAPALAGVIEGSPRREAHKVVDECEVGLPRQLNELPVPLREALGEVCGVNPSLLDDLTRFQLHFSNG